MDKKKHYVRPTLLETLKLQHNLDVMHIEKNICDNLVGTLLSIDGKNKDTDKASLGSRRNADTKGVTLEEALQWRI